MKAVNFMSFANFISTLLISLTHFKLRVSLLILTRLFAKIV